MIKDSDEQDKWLKNKLRSYSRKQYPSLKLTDFYKSGKITPNGLDKVRNYIDKLPEDMQERFKK